MNKRDGNLSHAMVLYKFVPYSKELHYNPSILLFHANENYALGMIGLTEDVYKNALGMLRLTADTYGPMFPAITLIHQSFELYLKSLLCLKNEKIKDYPRHIRHDVNELFEKSLKHYPSLDILSNNKDAKNLFIQFNHDNFSSLRYGEGSLIIGDSNSDKTSLMKLREIVSFIKMKFEDLIRSELALVSIK